MITKFLDYFLIPNWRKVSIIRSGNGIILGAKSFRSEYDGHTVEESLQQVERITGRKIKRLAGDRGYRGRKEINGKRNINSFASEPE